MRTDSCLLGKSAQACIVYISDLFSPLSSSGWKRHFTWRKLRLEFEESWTDSDSQFLQLIHKFFLILSDLQDSKFHSLDQFLKCRLCRLQCICRKLHRKHLFLYSNLFQGNSYLHICHRFCIGSDWDSFRAVLHTLLWLGTSQFHNGCKFHNFLFICLVVDQKDSFWDHINHQIWANQKLRNILCIFLMNQLENIW